MHKYFFILLISVLTLSGCTKEEHLYKESRMLMDTYCTITVVSSSEKSARAAINAGFDEIKKLELLLNYFSDESEISAINRSAGQKPVHVSNETIDILERSVHISNLSDRAFDPTLAPLIKLWNISSNNIDNAVPSKEEIATALNLVNINDLTIEKGNSEAFLKRRSMEIDLGGIAKGYAADHAIKAINDKGIRSALVTIAGDIKGSGKRLWKVGIQNPRPAEDSEKPWEDIIATVDLRDEAISTSGDYQRFFFKNGRRYHHILDRNTGFPARSGLISVTVIAPEGVMTDGLSTAVFVLGREKGIEMLKASDIDGALIDHDKNVYITESLKGRVMIINEEYKIIN